MASSSLHGPVTHILKEMINNSYVFIRFLNASNTLHLLLFFMPEKRNAIHTTHPVGRQHRKPPDFSVLQGCVSNMGFKWVVCVLDVQCGNGSQQGWCKIKWRFLLFKACRPGPSLLMEQCSHLFYETLMLTSMIPAGHWQIFVFSFPPIRWKDK